jgi:hypothetical protein
MIIARERCHSLIRDLWGAMPARAHVTLGTSAAVEVTELSSQVHALNSHSSLVCKGNHASRIARTLSGSMRNASMRKPQEGSVSVERQWAEGRGARGFSAAAADDSHGPEETEFHLRAERTLEHFQERIEVCSFSYPTPTRIQTWVDTP